MKILLPKNRPTGKVKKRSRVSWSLEEEQLITIVAADLHFLIEEWDQDVDTHSLRRTSPVLRRLLIDNDLQRAWRAIGLKKEPRIVTSSLANILSTTPKKKIKFAFGGGAVYRGVEIRGGLLLQTTTTASENRTPDSHGVPEVTLGLRAFLESDCIIVEGHSVSDGRSRGKQGGMGRDVVSD